MKPWNIFGFVVFPNIDNRKALRDAGLVLTEDELKVSNNLQERKNFVVNHCMFQMILTKNELNDPEHKLWIKLIEKNDTNPAPGKTLYM